jgi:hypothetical protein
MLLSNSVNFSIVLKHRQPDYKVSKISHSHAQILSWQTQAMKLFEKSSVKKTVLRGL